jgi:hypothetical protein
MKRGPGGKQGMALSFSLIKVEVAPEERPKEPVTGLAYTKALYTNIIDWYKDVQTRAQLLLTLDGAFVTILSGVIFAKGTDLQAATENFGLETWMFLGALGLSFGFSGLFTILALMPLGLNENRIWERFEKTMQEDARAGRTPPTSVMWYSQFVQRVGRDNFLRDSAKIGDREEQAALASQIFALSERLGRKYRWVFYGYVGAGAALLMLLLTVGSYLIRIRA